MWYGIAMICAAIIGFFHPAMADPKDYRFEPVSSQIDVSPAAKLAVRLVHLPDNKPVSGAIIFQSRLEMPMSGMSPMATKINTQPGDADGIYPFVADVSMAGPWALILTAKVNGEAANITSSIPLTAVAASHSHNH